MACGTRTEAHPHTSRPVRFNYIAPAEISAMITVEAEPAGIRGLWLTWFVSSEGDSGCGGPFLRATEPCHASTALAAPAGPLRHRVWGTPTTRGRAGGEQIDGQVRIGQRGRPWPCSLPCKAAGRANATCVVPPYLFHVPPPLLGLSLVLHAEVRWSR